VLAETFWKTDVVTELVRQHGQPDSLASNVAAPELANLGELVATVPYPAQDKEEEEPPPKKRKRVVTSSQVLPTSEFSLRLPWSSRQVAELLHTNDTAFLHKADAKEDPPNEMFDGYYRAANSKASGPWVRVPLLAQPPQLVVENSISASSSSASSTASSSSASSTASSSSASSSPLAEPVEHKETSHLLDADQLVLTAMELLQSQAQLLLNLGERCHSLETEVQTWKRKYDALLRLDGPE